MELRAPGLERRRASSAVITANPPGSSFASLTSMLTMRAWAWGLRRMAQWSIPGSSTSSCICARPVTSNGLSTRFIGLPTHFGSVTGRSSMDFRISTIAPSSLEIRFVRRLTAGNPMNELSPGPVPGPGLLVDGDMHGLQNLLIARAAADVPAQGLPDLLLAWVGIPLKQLENGHQEPRRTVAALKAVPLYEGLLQRMELPLRGQPLHRHQVGPVALHRQHETGANGAAVHQYRARAADPVLAAHVGPNQPQVLP